MFCVTGFLGCRNSGL